VIPRLQAINVATCNNLVVVAGVCFARHAILQVKVSEACPVYMLIAPEMKVTFGFLEDNTVAFFQEIFSSGDVNKACLEHFGLPMKVFHCEQFLAIALARYIRQTCKGKAVAARRERLLTEIFLGGKERTPENLREVRRLLKDGLRPQQQLIDAYSQAFLIGRVCPFTIDDLIGLVDRAQGAD
jgi:hypothetical protein